MFGQPKLVQCLNVKAGIQSVKLQREKKNDKKLLRVVIQGFDSFACGARFHSSCRRQCQRNQLTDRVQMKKTGDAGP